MPDYDFLDQFLVLGVESDHSGGRHAITYRYNHADSSRRVFAIWLLPSARAIGSTEPVRGRVAPILVATSASDVISKMWLNGRLIVAVSNTAVLMPNRIPACYFEDDQVRRVCFDPKIVDIDTR